MLYRGNDQDSGRLFTELTIGKAERAPAPEEMAKIQKLAPAPLDPENIFTFPGVISSDAVDTYFTFMHDSSLRRFVRDFKTGRSLLSSHVYTRLPLGKSYDAELVPVPEGELEGKPATQKVVVGWYIPRGKKLESGLAADDYIAGVEDGTYARMSIGFGGNDLEFRCTVDGSDLWDWDSEYYPGMKLDGELKEKYGPYVTYAVHNANAYEGSLVYANATPGALVGRIQEMIQRRKVAPVDLPRLERAYGVRFDRPGGWSPGVSRKGDSMLTAEQLIRLVLERAGAKFSKDTRAKLESALTDTESAAGTLATLLEAPADETNDEDRAILSELGTTRSIGAVKELKTLAEHGRRFIAAQVDSAVAARVAIMGNGFNADSYRASLQRMADLGDLDFVMGEAEAWAKQKGAAFYSGRKAATVDVRTESDVDALYEIETIKS